MRHENLSGLQRTNPRQGHGLPFLWLACPKHFADVVTLLVMLVSVATRGFLAWAAKDVGGLSAMHFLREFDSADVSLDDYHNMVKIIF